MDAQLHKLNNANMQMGKIEQRFDEVQESLLFLVNLIYPFYTKIKNINEKTTDSLEHDKKVSSNNSVKNITANEIAAKITILKNEFTNVRTDPIFRGDRGQLKNKDQFKKYSKISLSNYKENLLVKKTRSESLDQRIDKIEQELLNFDANGVKKYYFNENQTDVIATIEHIQTLIIQKKEKMADLKTEDKELYNKMYEKLARYRKLMYESQTKKNGRVMSDQIDEIQNNVNQDNYTISVNLTETYDEFSKSLQKLKKSFAELSKNS